MKAPIKVTVPSPEDLDINEFLPKSKTSKKTPNSYFIYRKVYVEELQKLGLKSKMIRVSSWSGFAWKEESHNVKLAYVQFANELSKLYENQLKEERERKRNEPIEIIEFKPESINNNEEETTETITETTLNQSSQDIPSINDQTNITTTTSIGIETTISHPVYETAAIIAPYDAQIFSPNETPAEADNPLELVDLCNTLSINNFTFDPQSVQTLQYEQNLNVYYDPFLF
ncbi:11145_t:CDS:1 [Ambispora gerdemannii]|uniref:11145_t:CDS:1 n=1 Tax=Ambispora gerdemannii TaxID=144530 RepID=A0A9N9C3H3_9GLOM|nr:11145_t:CDS:1 [Ambispora gerdemannii]